MTYSPSITEHDKIELWQALTTTSTPKSVLTEKLGMDARKLRDVAREINCDPNNDHLVLTDTHYGGYWRGIKNDGNAAAAYRYFYSEQSRRDELTLKLKIVEKKILTLYPTVGQGRLC